MRRSKSEKEELYRDFKRLRDDGMRVADIAERLGVTGSYLYQLNRKLRGLNTTATIESMPETTKHTYKKQTNRLAMILGSPKDIASILSELQ